jgi:protein-disulfide isomerase
MERRKILVLGTAFVGFCFFFAIVSYQGSEQAAGVPETIAVEKADAPTLGSEDAKVQVLIIEDLKCYGCAEFSEESFPEFYSKYVDRGLVRYTVVPVAFIQGSKEIGNIALEIYAQAPQKFFSFISQLFALVKEGRLKEDSPLRIARNLEGVDYSKLQACIDAKCHYQKLDENIDWAKAIMGSGFRTPAVYVNGKRISRVSLEEVTKMVDQALEEMP